MCLRYGYVLLLFVFPCVVRGELPALEMALEPAVNSIHEAAPSGKIVVAVRSLVQQPWPVHVAIANEISLGLSGIQHEAISAATDLRIEDLVDRREAFAPKEIDRLKSLEANWFLSGELRSGRESLELHLGLWDVGRKTLIWSERLPLKSDAIAARANVPEDNRELLEFVRSRIGQQVEDGECSSLAAEGLKAAAAKRYGVYAWGRELDDQEPILPGDILQIENASLRDTKFSRSYPHHTAIIEEVLPNKLVVLHQNVQPKGKIVQRDSWPRTAEREGLFVAYRPWNKEPLPLLTPKRRTSAKLVLRNNEIDLLRAIDPHLDRVRGLWYMKDHALRVHREDFATLQVPVDLPESYTVQMKVRRLFGKNNVGLGLVVGNAQTVLILDAYESTISGLHLVNGESVKSNQTTYRSSQPLLPQGVDVDVRVAVTPGSIHAHAGNTEIVNWSGQPIELGMDDRYAVPEKTWLFLAGKNTHFEVREFTLLPKP